MRLLTSTVLVLLSLLLNTPFQSFGQETSATLSGHITDTKGTLLNGATIELKHIPTGAVANTQTNNKGLFYLTNLKPGGPYSITITYVGFKEINLSEINLGLGTNPDLNLNLEAANKDLVEVVVTGSRRAPTGGLTVDGLNSVPYPPLEEV